MAQVFDISKDGPTLLYPNGGETVTDGSITIRWVEPSGIPSTEVVWYELLLVEDYSDDSRPAYIQIGTVLSGYSSFVYRIPKNVRGDRCRIGIRAVNHRGQRSQISYSASNFSISNKRLPQPAVFQPVKENTYFSYVPFTFQHDAILGRCSQRAFYQIYYSSESQEIDWRLLASNIMVGSEPLDIDVSSFATAADYVFKVELVDGDNVSEPVFVRDVSINNINYFLIDTLPPRGRVQVQNNSEYINTEDVIVKLEAYDEASAVCEVRMEQTDVNSGDVTTGLYLPMSQLTTWHIQGDDGEKLIQARFKDYAGNTVDSSSTETFFRTYKSMDNREVTAFLYYDGDVYSTFAADENTSVALPQLYKNQSLVSTLDGEATSMVFFNGVLYLAIKDDENKGILQRYASGTLETVRDNADQYVDEAETVLNSLFETDSVIVSMVVFDDKLFMGLQNGRLLSFSGTTITEEEDTYENQRSICKLATDGNLLYVFFDNTTEIMVMYVGTTGAYVFTTIDTGS
jgi:hypothetical protein